MTIAFKGKIWVMGGTSLTDADNPVSNSVWSTEDAIHWENVVQAAPWSPRTAAPIVSFKDRLWIFGGLEVVNGRKVLKNDVWSSDNGRDWYQVTENAPWTPRAYHAALAYDGKIWVLGGGKYNMPDSYALNDVWSSEDGITWTKVGNAQWPEKIWFSALVYQNRMWVVGGWNKDSLNQEGIWYSADGKVWTRLEVSDTWRARHEQSAVVLNDAILIAGGHADPLTREVWELKVPRLWVALQDLFR
jgi:hypothetical protein